MQLKYGEVSARELCTYNSLAQVVSQALGGKPQEVKDPTAGKNFDQALREINNLF